MKFGPVDVRAAEGAVLAHSLRIGGRVLKKGRRLAAGDIALLVDDGVATVVVARLEADDAPEDVAAERVAAGLAPDPPSLGVSVSAPFTGRANIFAEAAGVLEVDADLVAAVNAIDETITLATLAPMSRVAPRQMLATVKVIPYAAPEPAVAQVERVLAAAREEGRAAVRLAAFRSKTASLILTRTPGMKDAVVEKGAEAVRARLDSLGARLVDERVVAHETAALAEAISTADGDIVLVLAASATSDRRDVAPAAVVAAGGRVDRLGMPVDPGNLLALGRLGDRFVVGLPGCARSPKLNGADWVLERLVAGLRVSGEDVAAMGVGGLLKEIPSRPEPRGGGARAPSKPFVSGVLLAAGGSRRMGGRHKLLEEIDGVPLARRAAERLLASGVDEVVAIVGARSEDMRAALSGLGLRIVVNTVWEEGMASSIRTALEAIAPTADAAVLAFADMPEVDARLIDRIVAAFDPEEGRAIVRPVGPSGRPGHPVLFGRRFFEALAQLTGDAGAREVVRDHAGFVTDLAVDDEAATIDLDTPEDWSAWRERVANQVRPDKARRE